MISPAVQENPLRSLPRLRATLAVLCLCLTAACAQSLAPAATVMAPAQDEDSSSAFIGRWAYTQSCGLKHSAELELSAAVDGIHGAWNDGTRIRGDSGELRGALRADKLWLSFCRDMGTGDPEACPNFGPERAYATLDHGRLVWYRNYGTDGYREYLRLHRVIANAEIPTDDHCPEADSGPDGGPDEKGSLK